MKTIRDQIRLNFGNVKTLSTQLSFKYDLNQDYKGLESYFLKAAGMLELSPSKLFSLETTPKPENTALGLF